MMDQAPVYIREKTHAETLKQFESSGRASGTLAGGWVSDLAALGKCIMLCDACHPKWNYSAVGYYRVNRPVPASDHVMGSCDGCKEFTQCRMFLRRETK